MAIILPNGKQSFTTPAGIPLVGGKVYTYAAGTNTPQATYTDAGGTVPNTNPVVLDARGEATIFWDGSYKVVLRDFLDNLIWSIDNITTIDPTNGPIKADLASTAAAKGSNLVMYNRGTANSVPATVRDTLKRTVSVQEFGCNGAGSGDFGLALQRIHDEVLGADGGAIQVPSGRSGGGNYPTATTANFTKPVDIVAEGGRINAEVLLQSNIKVITTTNYLRVRGLGITAIGAGLDASVLIDQLYPANSQNGSGATDCNFSGGSIQWRSLDASQMHFMGCEFGNYSSTGLWTEDQTNSDRGDSFVTNSVFAGRAGATGIRARNAGLYVTACKWNGNQAYGVQLDAGLGPLGDYTFQGCSFEGYTAGAISIFGATAVPGNVITKTLITGNQFSSTVSNNPYIYLGPWAQHTTIVGNTFNDQGTTATGIAYDNDASEIVIADNLFYDINTAISGPGTVSKNPGITIANNRYSESVGQIYIQGEQADNLNNTSSQKSFKVSRVITNASNSVYVDAWKWLGICTARVRVWAVVQGVGRAQYAGEFLCNDVAAPVAIGTAAVAGALFDVQVAAAGGQMRVSIKRNGETGSSVVAYVQVELDGYVSYLAKA